MKSILFSILFSITTATIALAGIPVTPIVIGSALPDASTTVKDISGDDLKVEELADENGLLVLFSCNTCPYVLAWEDRYPVIADICETNNIGFVVLNSNEAKRDNADSYDAMQAKASEADYNFYYAVDENHVWADALGASKTPDAFLFDGELKLAYQGAIDDNMKQADSVEEAFLQNAILNMVAGEEIDPETTKAIGCSIKRLD